MSNRLICNNCRPEIHPYFIYQPSDNVISDQNDVIWSIPAGCYDSCAGKKINIEIYKNNNQCIWSKEYTIPVSASPNVLKYTYRILEFVPSRSMYYPVGSPPHNSLHSYIEIMGVKFINNILTNQAKDEINFSSHDKFLIKTTVNCNSISLATDSYGDREEIIKDMQSWIFLGKQAWVSGAKTSQAD